MKNKHVRRGYNLEKKTIIDELFRESKIYVDETFDMKCETLDEYEEIPSDCPICKYELDEIYCRSDKKDDYSEKYDLVVLKCSPCKTYYSFFVGFFAADDWPNDMGDHQSETRHSFPLESARKRGLSKRRSEKISTVVSLLESKNKELNSLIQTKLAELYKAGLSLVTINLARNEVITYQKYHKDSPKSARALLASAIYVKANSVTSQGLWKHKGEGVSERQLEEIFRISRKTIRKWAKILSSRSY